MESLESLLMTLNSIHIWISSLVILLILISAVAFEIAYFIKSKEVDNQRKRFLKINKAYAKVCEDNLKKDDTINFLKLELDRCKVPAVVTVSKKETDNV